MGQTASYYSEKQRFRQRWLWILILILSLTGPVAFLWAILQQVVTASPTSTYPTSDLWFVILGIIVCVGFGLGIPLLLYVCRLDTEVREYGVCIRFRPFHRKWVVFNFHSIQDVKALIYSPIRDYGGWGIRYSRKGKAYNVSGKKGVLVTLKDGKRILIGSKHSDVLYSELHRHLVSESGKLYPHVT